MQKNTTFTTIVRVKKCSFTTIVRVKKCHFYYDMQKTSFYLLFYKIVTHHIIELVSFWMKIVMQSTRDDIDK
jgi:hypothetical protein